VYAVLALGVERPNVAVARPALFQIVLQADDGPANVLEALFDAASPPSWFVHLEDQAA
jgi:hypothetical protein